MPRMKKELAEEATRTSYVVAGRCASCEPLPGCQGGIHVGKKLLALGLAALALGLSAGDVPAQECQGNIADPQLEAAVQAARQMSSDGLGPNETCSLVELDAAGWGIGDLSGIQELQALEVLFLGDNDIGDLTPLAGLSRLRALDLSHNQVQDIAPLSGLDQLTYLNLEGNSIGDLAPLSSLTQLEVLYLTGNQIRDLSPLLSLGHAMQVEARANPLSEETHRDDVPALLAMGTELAVDPYEPPPPVQPPIGPPASSGTDLPDMPGMILDWQYVGPDLHDGAPAASSMAVSPSHPAIQYMAAEDGLWRSEDGGRSWERTGLMSAPRLTYTVLIDPADPFTVYLAGSLYEAGSEALRSRDGGRTWEMLESGVSLIGLDGQRPGRLFGKLDGRLAVSLDYGTSWRLTEIADEYFILVRTDPDMVYGWRYAPESYTREAGTLYVSRDQGQLWEVRPQRPVFLSVAADPADPKVLYASVDDAVWVTRTGGDGWKRAHVFEAEDHSVRLLVHPRDSQYQLAHAHGEVLWMTRDGGDTWEEAAFPSWVTSAYLHPVDPEILYAFLGSMSGEPIAPKVSGDGGRTWQDLALPEVNRGISALHADAGGRLLATYANTDEEGRAIPGICSSDDGGGTFQVSLPDVDLSRGWMSSSMSVSAAALHADPADPDVLLANLDGYYMRSEDGGQSWGGTPVWGSPVSSYGDAVYDPQQEGVVYVGARGVMRSENAGMAWTERSGGLPREKLGSSLQWVVIDGLVMDPQEPMALYAACRDSLFRTDDGGENWQFWSQVGEGQSIYTIALNPLDDRSLYAATSEGLYVSGDWGWNWELLVAPGWAELPRVRFRFDPSDADRFYVVTGRKLLGTWDGGVTWQDLGRDLVSAPWFSDVAIDPMDPTRLHVSTPWGLYVLDMEQITAVEEGGSIDPRAFGLGQNWPNPFNSGTVIDYQVPVSGGVRVTVYNAAGQVVRRLLDEDQTAGAHRLVWHGRNDDGLRVGSGVYSYVLEAGASRRVRRLTLVK